MAFIGQGSVQVPILGIVFETDEAPKVEAARKDSTTLETLMFPGSLFVVGFIFIFIQGD